MNVSDLMVKEVITCGDNASLADAAGLMWEKDIGFLPIVSESGALAGVITDRDAFIAAYFAGKPLREIPVKTAMSTRIATCAPETAIGEAEAIMSERQVHRLPVLAGGKVAGVVSLNDIAREAARDADEDLEEEVAVTLGAIAQPRTPPALSG